MIRELASAVLSGATRAAGKAAGKLMEDPRGQEAVARAVGVAQRTKKLVDEVQERTFHAAGIAARRDLDESRKQIARIKRKMRELSAKLEDAKRDGEPPR
jgi:hypothetical protein